jgi:hypothetical protein
MKSLLLRLLAAVLASSVFMVTKPKPRERPVSRSVGGEGGRQQRVGMGGQGALGGAPAAQRGDERSAARSVGPCQHSAQTLVSGWVAACGRAGTACAWAVQVRKNPGRTGRRGSAPSHATAEPSSRSSPVAMKVSVTLPYWEKSLNRSSCERRATTARSAPA